MAELNITHLFHSAIEDGEDNNLVQPSDWNDIHVVDGVGTVRLPILVEKKVLTGSNSFTFSNLDGNSAEEYLLICDVYITYSTGETMIRLAPNNDSGANYSNIVSRYAVGWVTAGNWSSPYNIIWFSGAGANQRLQAQTVISAKSGSERLFRSSIITKNTLGFMNFVWTNTVDNITSMVCSVTNGTISGTVKLYKMVDLVLGEE